MRVAIVDDDELVGPTCARLVHKLRGDEAVWYATAAAFIASTDYRQADCLIIDYHLDGQMNGCELIDKLRTDGVMTPVVLVSGDITTAATALGHDSSHVVLLTKPSGASELNCAVEAALVS